MATTVVHTNEAPNQQLVNKEYGSHNWGLHVERLLEDPWRPKILYKIERAGLCLPAFCQDQCFGGCCAPCKIGKKRSYLYIMENAIEQNMSCFDPCTAWKTARCAEDYVTKMYFDNGALAPWCFCDCPRGIATENDLNYCCFCINCVCIYDICTKPCCGGMVATTLFPNDHCLYPIITRCNICHICCVSPVLYCVKDSEDAKKNLIEAMRLCEQRKKNTKGVKTYQEMTANPGGAGPTVVQVNMNSPVASPVAVPVASPVVPEGKPVSEKPVSDEMTRE